MSPSHLHPSEPSRNWAKRAAEGSRVGNQPPNLMIACKKTKQNADHNSIPKVWTQTDGAQSRDSVSETRMSQSFAPRKQADDNDDDDYDACYGYIITLFWLCVCMCVTQNVVCLSHGSLGWNLGGRSSTRVQQKRASDECTRVENPSAVRGPLSRFLGLLLI